jgi:gamma-glutamyltranspeptidase
LYNTYSASTKIGSVVKRPDLAATLRVLADDPLALYHDSPLRTAVLAEWAAAGVLITKQDLEEYSVGLQPIVDTFFRGYRVVSASAPFGGPVLMQALNTLEFYDDTNAHFMVESLKWAYSNRQALADPSYVADVNARVLPAMLSKEHAALLREKIDPRKTFGPSYYSDLVNVTNPPPEVLPPCIVSHCSLLPLLACSTALAISR